MRLIGSILLIMRNVWDKSRWENQNTHFMLNNILQKIMPFMRSCEKIWHNQTHTDDNTILCMCFACQIISLQTHSQNTQYLLLFHCNNGYMHLPQCYIVRTVQPVLFFLIPYVFHKLECQIKENFPLHMFNITEDHGRSATIMLIHKYLLKVPHVWVK
jgi:hypothetical protein